MGTSYTKAQLLALAGGIGRGIINEEPSLVEAGKLSIEDIDPETKEGAIDVLLDLLEKIKIREKTEEYDTYERERLLNGATFILGIWKVKRAVPVISTLLEYSTYATRVHKTAANALKDILEG